MTKQSLHIVSAMEGSIGEITNDLVPYFKDEFDLTIEGEDDPKGYETLLCHFINLAVVKAENFSKFKKKILIQPIDGTSIKKEVIDSINKFDLIITPGEAGKTIMIANGVTKPIKVIRNFYKDSLFKMPINNIVPELPKDKIIFYHESTCHPRKGMDILYEAFIKTFSDTEYANEVVLIVKSSPFNERTWKREEDLKKEIISLQKQYKNPAQIIKISQNLKEETLKKIWNNIDIYVSMARVEGFGIPLLRMALLNKPIIALDTEISGYVDWLKKDETYLIPTKLVTAEEEFMFLYKHDTKWATPINLEVVMQTYKNCFLNLRNDGMHKLVNANNLIEMRIDNIAQQYIQVIKEN